MALQPDRLAGRTIYRGVASEGGVNVQTKTVVFPPTVVHGAPRVLTLDEQVEIFMARLVTVSDATADPVIKAQAVMFQKRIARAARAALHRATLIERERIRQLLLKQALPHAAAAVEGT